MQYLPTLAATAALFSSMLGLTAQQPPPQPAPDPAITALLDKVERCHGKLPATLRVDGRYEVLFEGNDKPVAAGAYRELHKGDDRSWQRSDMGPGMAMLRGTTADMAWEVDPSMGSKVRRGEQEAAVRRYFAVLRGDGPRAHYIAFELGGTERLGDAEVTVLKARSAGGQIDEWRIDGDGCVRRVDMVLPAPESADATWNLDDGIAAKLTFGDFRDVGGRKLAHARALAMGPATVKFTISKAEAAAVIEDREFAPPESVLKATPESAAPAFGPDGKPNYTVVERKAQPVASIRLKCKPADISATLATILPEVMAHLTETGARMAGAPFSRYHAVTDGEIDLEAGIPVQQKIEGKGRVKASELPAGNAVTAWHIGPYQGLHAAHEALAAWAGKHDKAVVGGPWEVYWTDPGMVTDPAKWKTQLFLPVK